MGTNTLQAKAPLFTKMAGVALMSAAPMMAFAQNVNEKSAIGKLAKSQGIDVQQNRNIGSLVQEAETGAQNIYSLIAVIVMVIGLVFFVGGLLNVHKRSKQEQPTGPAWVAAAIGVLVGSSAAMYLYAASSVAQSFTA